MTHLTHPQKGGRPIRGDLGTVLFLWARIHNTQNDHPPQCGCVIEGLLVNPMLTLVFWLQVFDVIAEAHGF